MIDINDCGGRGTEAWLSPLLLAFISSTALAGPLPCDGSLNSSECVECRRNVTPKLEDIACKTQAKQAHTPQAEPKPPLPQILVEKVNALKIKERDILDKKNVVFNDYEVWRKALPSKDGCGIDKEQLKMLKNTGDNLRKALNELKEDLKVLVFDADKLKESLDIELNDNSNVELIFKMRKAARLIMEDGILLLQLRLPMDFATDLESAVANFSQYYEVCSLNSVKRG